MNIAIKKRDIEYFTHIIIIFTFAAKSITSHKFNLLTFISAESIAAELFLSLTTSSFIYRAVSPLSLTYKFYEKLYFIVANLYMRYTSLSKSRRIKNLITILFIIFMQNLYEKFYNKKKRVIFTLNKILYFSANQKIVFNCQCSDSTVKTSFFIITKSIT